MRKSWRFILVLIMFVALILVFYFFEMRSVKQIYDHNAEYIQDATYAKAAHIDEVFQNNLSSIQTISYLYGQTLTGEQFDRYKLSAIEANSEFDWVRFCDINGYSHTSKGEVFSCSDREYYQHAMKGSSGICSIPES